MRLIEWGCRAARAWRARGLLLLALLPLPGAAAITVQDDAGRTVTLAQPAQRIVSLAPHATELLFAIGAGERIVGTVSHSDYPPAADGIPRVGGYSRLDLERIVALEPALIVGWSSGNPSSTLARLRALGFAVYETEPRQVSDIAEALRRLGALTGERAQAEAAAQRLAAGFAELREAHAGARPVATFYQVWDNPLLTVNDEHIISQVIALCGGRNVFGDLAALTPRVDVEAVLVADPQAIVASGMAAARPEWLDAWRAWPALRAVRSGQLYFVPPDLLQRPTPRLLTGARQLCAQLAEARAAMDEETVDE